MSEGTRTWRMICCVGECAALAMWELRGIDDPYDMTLLSCDQHIAALLQDGTSMIWPVNR